MNEPKVIGDGRETNQTRDEHECSLYLTSEKSRVYSKVGRGCGVAHHGEILQGVFEDSGGSLRRGLITLPYNMLKANAIFFPDSNGVLQIEPEWKIKARQAVELTLTEIDAADCGGLLKIDSHIPVGWGLGSSTSDVIATIRAVTNALGKKVPREVTANLAVKAETSSDSIMFGDRAVLFAHRDGFVIEDLGGPLPPLEVLGFTTDPTGAGIDTLNFPPARYTRKEIEMFRPLLGLIRKAIYTQDARLLGRVASASACINQRFLPKPQFDGLQALVEEVGALGLQVAHSGTVVGMLFDVKDPSTEKRIGRAQASLSRMGTSRTWRFRTDEGDLAAL